MAAFNAKYDAPFVIASFGQSMKGSKSGDGLILDDMLLVDGTSGKYPARCVRYTICASFDFWLMF
jgi:hypothetical protein